ncbi:major facilitator superfamily domain-containing protein [Suillus subalutaceus]|uniref:major facilitator superfamily domain-containing protein n=1 Tax=Suillus subalutaceus TaxID=48586 RepID=UPI001B88661C|nr:major facilitator superfamily domain-containing protein [Suillus subalutaceus]KAG1868251.1 major facilitator superfamily domain-containing protein [Suillus subalutaceus]
MALRDLLTTINPFSSHQETNDDNEEFKLPSMASLVIMLVMNFLLQVRHLHRTLQRSLTWSAPAHIGIIFIIVSSANEYAEYLGGNATFSGVVIGIPTGFAVLSLIPLTQCDKGLYKMPLHISCCFAIIGHVAYAVAYRANFLYLILIGRCLTGVSFTMFMYCKRYCTDPRIIGIRRRTTLAGWQVVCQGLGLSLGPFLGGLLYKIGFSNSIFNGYTSPGWIMAGIYAGFWVLVTQYFEDIPQPPPMTMMELSLPVAKGLEIEHCPNYSSAPATSLPLPIDESFRAQLSLITLSQWGVIICMCWFSMVCFFILGSWEANLPVFGAATANLRWSPFDAGNFIALGGIICFPFLLANILAARRIQDRKLLAFGTTVGLAGLTTFLSILYTDTVNYSSLFACWCTVALGFNIATAITLSLLSKQLPPYWNGRTSIVIQCSNFTGRVTGTIWGGSGVSVGMMNFVILEIVMVGIGVILFTTLWNKLKTKNG